MPLSVSHEHTCMAVLIKGSFVETDSINYCISLFNDYLTLLFYGTKSLTRKGTSPEKFTSMSVSGIYSVLHPQKEDNFAFYFFPAFGFSD